MAGTRELRLRRRNRRQSRVRWRAAARWRRKDGDPAILYGAGAPCRWCAETWSVGPFVRERRMKPARFDYVRADDLTEVHAVLAEHGNAARIVAGGQTLLPMLSMRLVRPRSSSISCTCRRYAGSRRQKTTFGSAPAYGRRSYWPGPILRRPCRYWPRRCLGLAMRKREARDGVWVDRARRSERRIPLVLLALDGAVELSSLRRRRRARATSFFWHDVDRTSGR